MEMVFVLGVVWVFFTGLGWHVSVQKGRPEMEGLALGFLFGPLGCLIAALLPAVERRAERPRAIPRPSWSEPYDPEAEAIESRALAWIDRVESGQ